MNLRHIHPTSPKSVRHYYIAKITKFFSLVFILQSWDPDLAKTARGWAKRCEFKHNIYLQEPGQAHPRFTSVGENLWTGSLSIFSVQDAITSWYKEVRDYTYTTNSCSRICGHYTQVRHRTSSTLSSLVVSSTAEAAHRVRCFGPLTRRNISRPWNVVSREGPRSW